LIEYAIYTSPGVTALAWNGLEDLGLLAGTGVLDKVPDVHDAMAASVGALAMVEMRIMVLGRWVRGCARLSGVHSLKSFLWAGPGECSNTRPGQ
jgi:hypothetical protein